MYLSTVLDVTTSTGVISCAAGIYPHGLIHENSEKLCIFFHACSVRHHKVLLIYLTILAMKSFHTLQRYKYTTSPSIDRLVIHGIAWLNAQGDDGYTVLSPTEEGIVPLHGVRTPQHDFFAFNRQRSNTVIQVSHSLSYNLHTLSFMAGCWLNWYTSLFCIGFCVELPQRQSGVHERTRRGTVWEGSPDES